MKNYIAIFILTAIFGLCCGGIYQLTLGDGNLIVTSVEMSSKEVADENDNAAEGEKSSEKKSNGKAKNNKSVIIVKEDDENDDNSSSKSTKSKKGVTNKEKECSVPGCENSVFVTYRGRPLCVQCYGEEKKANTEAEAE